MRSKNGNAYWHTGHEILKKASNTGPRDSASCNENVLLSIIGNVKTGALLPVDNTCIVFPPNMRLSQVIAGLAFLFFDDTCAPQDFFCQAGKWQLVQPLAANPGSFNSVMTHNLHFVIGHRDRVAHGKQLFI